tara:strand:+ start:2429 stop:3193 length:765 start_codon:yes stop_codon:yes gene_type:complete
MVFFPDIYDTLSIKISDKTNITIKGAFAKELISRGGDKLISKTIKEFANFFSKNIKIDVVLKKEIPLGSGLGGGSADASAVARAICKIFKIKYKKKELLTILKRIGADCPACFFSTNLLAEGIGEKITFLKKINYNPWTLIITPPINISTKKIFDSFQGPFSKKNKLTYSVSNLLYDMNNFKNPLEEVVKKEFHSLNKLFKSLPKINNIIPPRMSGTGSSIFILFNTQKEAEIYLSNIERITTDCWKKISQLRL